LHFRLSPLAAALRKAQGESLEKGNPMRALEIIAALIVAGIVFVTVKVLGMVLHVALIAAVIGLVVGFVIARAFRRPA
jgi:Flp pilus assembly protein TadB